ncbi:hypothetical protein Hanom_Chr09g00851671 [Helianthus anomalus]
MTMKSFTRMMMVRSVHGHLRPPLLPQPPIATGVWWWLRWVCWRTPRRWWWFLFLIFVWWVMISCGFLTLEMVGVDFCSCFCLVFCCYCHLLAHQILCSSKLYIRRI